MCYPVYGMMDIKDPFLLIGKSSLCSGGSGFPLSLAEWSFAICHITIKQLLPSSVIKRCQHNMTHLYKVQG